MNIDHTLSLPQEIFPNINKNLDTNSAVYWCQVSKRINEIVSLELLDILGIVREDKPETREFSLLPYCQLMKFYRDYCNFFIKRVRGLAIEVNDKVGETKQKIDQKLSEHIPFNQSFLDECWRRFILNIRLSCSGGHSHKLEEDTRFDDQLDQVNDEAAQFFLRAGASGASKAKLNSVVETLIEQSWCSEETLLLLINHNFPTCSRTIAYADKIEKFKKYIPLMVETFTANSISLNLFMSDMPKIYEPLFEKYIDKYGELIEVETYDILVGIQKKYSEKILSKLLKNCEEIDDYVIRLAIEGKYSNFTEDFIRELINKNPSTLTDYHIKQALGRYSLNILEKIYNKIDPNENPVKFSARTIQHAMSEYLQDGLANQLYDKKLIEFLLSHVDENELIDAVESVIKYGRAEPYETIVEQYLPKAIGEFSLYVFHHLVFNGYSENFILCILERVGAETLKAVTLQELLLAVPDKNLDNVMAKYSHKIIGIFLNGQEHHSCLDSRYIKTALDMDYPEDVMSKLVDFVSTVGLKDIKRAREKYSLPLITKMQTKCYEKESCIIS